MTAQERKQRHLDRDLYEKACYAAQVDRAVRQYRWRVENDAWTNWAELVPASVRASLEEAA